MELFVNKTLTAVDLQVGVTHSNRELCARISELGWLYRRVCNYVTRTMDRVGLVGLVEQSFCAAVQAELTDYYRLIATLESQVVAALADTDGATTNTSLSESGVVVPARARRALTLSLKRLLIWVDTPMHTMTVLAPGPVTCDVSEVRIDR